MVMMAPPWLWVLIAAALIDGDDGATLVLGTVDLEFDGTDNDFSWWTLMALLMARPWLWGVLIWSMTALLMARPWLWVLIWNLMALL